MSEQPAAPAHRYSADLAGEIETRWQERWAELGTYAQPNPGEDGFDGSRPKFYCLDMFPYPSGAGLHVGHPEGYTATDIVCRYKRMKGFNVLHPMGWDAFGLPAEQYAIQTGVHPEITTKKAIDNFRRQLQRFGFCYDWSREFGTIDADYYKWTQWIFLKIYNAWYDTEQDKARHIDELIAELESGARPAAINPDAAEYQGAGSAGEEVMPWASLDADAKRAIIDSYRLAYISLQTVNWCPKLGTALANEEVIDGRSERGGHPVLRKPLRQWMFRITAFADRLLRDLDGLDWPQSTKTQQAEWIGKSVGAEIDFTLLGRDGEPTGESLRVFTTRPDTLFGATYMVVAPEHPLIDNVLNAPHEATDEAKLRDYVEWARNRSDVERQENKEKTGVYTGVDAVNPATGDRIPVWTADYVLVTYGSGAIMAVPGHDERDFAFAQTFGLPIREVVLPTTLAAMRYYAGEMTPAEADGDAWASILADFLGYVVSGDVKPSGYAEALRVVRTRRTVLDGPEERAVSDSESETAGGPGRARRGAVRMTWVDAIAEMKIDSPAALRARFGRDHAMDDVYSGSGIAVNSAGSGVSLDNLPTAEAKWAITAWLAERNLGGEKVNYKLRDWLFSRQRYWGEPFPIVFDEQGHHYGVDESALPIKLPPLADYQPIESEDPTPLLGKATDWLHTTAGEAGVSSLPADAKIVREANTMPGWAGSCWYEIRYCDPKNTERFVGREAESYWMGKSNAGEGGVDLYIGGAEHAVLHLLYARFWHKALFDLGEVSAYEPFRKLFHQGLIQSHAFQRADKSLAAVDAVENRGTEEKPEYVETETGDRVTQVIAKMSKSLKNVVNPDDVIAEYGADTFRLYEMYMGPLEQAKPWNTRDISGMHRFLQRAWRVCVDEATGAPRVAAEADAGLEKLLHRTIDKVGDDIERLAFNTAIAAMIELVNAATKRAEADGAAFTADQMDRFARILAPFAPHVGEEVWAKLGRFEAAGSIALAPWPEVDASLLKDDEVEIAVQIMGKVRSKVMVPTDADAKAMEAIALADDKIKAQLEGKTVRKVIAVPGRMVNIVAN